MDDLRSRLDQRASRFHPRPDAYEHVRARAAARRARRRVASGVVAVAVAVAALGGLWSVTHEVGQPMQSVTPTLTVPPAEPARDLRIALNAKVDAWIPLDDGIHTWVVGAGTLSTVDRATGNARIVARGNWDYDYASIFAYGEGTVLVADGSSVWEVIGPGTARRIDLGLGTISALLQTGQHTWVAATGADGGVLAEIDISDGHAIQTFPIGQGVYQLAAMPGYLFVGTRETRGPAVLRLDLSTGQIDPVPDAEGLAIAVSNGRLWWAYANRIHCVDGQLLTPCGDIDVRAPVALAGDGDSLWVLSATGSTSDTLYEPDPEQPAQLTELDGKTGDLIAGPIDLPDTTPARLSVRSGRAWVGFHDSGRVVLVERCAAAGCRVDLAEILRQRLAGLEHQMQVQAFVLAELRVRYDELLAIGKPSETAAQAKRIGLAIRKATHRLAHLQLRAGQVRLRLGGL